jgi:hypothetical protein
MRLHEMRRASTQGLFSRPTDIAKAAALLAAYSSALARAVLAGRAAATACLANATASGGTNGPCQASMVRAVSSSVTLCIYTEC